MATVGIIPKLCWSPQKESMNIDRRQTSGQTTACVAAISKTYGVEHISFFKRSVDSLKFIKFLNELA